MQNLEYLRFTVDRDSDSSLKIWLYWGATEGALDHMSFLFYGGEALDLFEGRVSLLADIVHHVKTFGESFTFFDYGADHKESSGIANVPYRRIVIPHKAQGFIADRLKNAIVKYDQQDDPTEDWKTKPEIRIDMTQDLGYWSEHYGQGKGTWILESNQDDIAARISAHRGESSFDRSWGNIERLALNTTASKEDIATIHIFEESPTSFLWTAGRMSGGLINHGTVESPSWSVHT